MLFFYPFLSYSFFLKIPLMKIPDRPFQINYLRSVALKNTRTDFVFYIEADFIPSLDLRKELLKNLYHHKNSHTFTIVNIRTKHLIGTQ